MSFRSGVSQKSLAVSVLFNPSVSRKLLVFDMVFDQSYQNLYIIFRNPLLSCFEIVN